MPKFTVTLSEYGAYLDYDVNVEADTVQDAIEKARALVDSGEAGEGTWIDAEESPLFVVQIIDEHDKYPLFSVHEGELVQAHSEAGIMLSALRAIRDAGSSTGRWLDSSGAECAKDEPGARWQPYSAEEQADLLAALVSLATNTLATVAQHTGQVV